MYGHTSACIFFHPTVSYIQIHDTSNSFWNTRLLKPMKSHISKSVLYIFWSFLFCLDDAYLQTYFYILSKKLFSSKLLKTVQTWSKLIQTDPNWSNLVKTDPNWTKLIQTGENWWQLSRTGQNWSKQIETDHNWSKLFKTDPKSKLFKLL